MHLNQSLPYPGLITGLCAAQGVRGSSNEEEIKPKAPITGTYVTKLYREGDGPLKEEAHEAPHELEPEDPLVPQEMVIPSSPLRRSTRDIVIREPTVDLREARASTRRSVDKGKGVAEAPKKRKNNIGATFLRWMGRFNRSYNHK